MRSFLLQIVAPEGIIFEGKVEKIDLPGWEGQLGVLYQHAPLLVQLRAGTVSFTPEKQAPQSLSLQKGTFWVADNRAVLLKHA
ncbi:MAG: FoF1 ATP synthase subunit delta/epsilon [Bacteroidia bacterium]